jgi:dipeptidyl aminopeptidase/acylaminoacyl peptidase
LNKPKYKKMKRSFAIATLLFLVTVIVNSKLSAQGTANDYERAMSLEKKFTGKVFYGNVMPSWIGKTNFFWYENFTPEGKKYVLIDAKDKTRKEAFNTAKMAAALNKTTGDTIKSGDLPVKNLLFTDDLRKLTFEYKGWKYTCDLKSYIITKGEEAEKPAYDPEEWPWGYRNELDNKPISSPDKKWTAFIRDFNLWIRNEADKKEYQLSNDGGNGKYYSAFIYWAPGSDKLMAYKVRPAVRHMISYIESSPADQLQPKYYSYEYPKAGDDVPQFYPQIFNVTEKKHIAVDEESLPDQFDVSGFQWDTLGRFVTFEYNKRGHQVYRIMKIDAATGRMDIIIDEQSKTFIDYSSKRFRYDLPETNEIIWASERDGWNHLYLYDSNTGQVKNQITTGKWVVRDVTWVDKAKRELVFEASGKEEGDPYLIHYYRISFDGTGLTLLTPEEGNHVATFSGDNKYFVDVWSKVDMAPVAVLRDSKDGKIVMPLEKADLSRLQAEGWRAPAVFTAKGRDGVTDIWGIIIRPTNFDPSKTYPVIEYIYAGPHSSFVPKSFQPFYRSMNPLCELGFIIVQIDGMGTSNRSKAFHDVCYKNLKDAGFPDRILWMKAAAKKYPYMDISRVGIYGTSAGGQESTAALLFYPEFYKAAVSSCGCHDNRMDKMWWNEQFMGWPVDQSYIDCSNTENAWRLQGKLMLINGEMDNNVDPQTTVQLVDALIKAGKDFDYLLVPGMKHSSGGVYGERRRMDFFVKNLMGVTPPDRNKTEEEKK